jgi:competence protein ComEA
VRTRVGHNRSPVSTIREQALRRPAGASLAWMKVRVIRPRRARASATHAVNRPKEASMLKGLFAVLVCLVLAGGAHAAVGQATNGPKAAAPQAAPPVNLNTATVAQIATLPGIGEKAAQRIVEYREKNGGFKKVEDLMNVKGIGEKSFLKLKPLVTVGEKSAKQ